MNEKQNVFRDMDFNTVIKSVQPVFLNPLEKQSKEIEKILREANEHKARVDQAIIDTSKTTKKIVEETKETNRQLMTINSNLEKQLQSINSNIDFIINTIGANAQISEKQQKENQKLLLEIQIILAQRDEEGLKSFVGRHIGDAIGLSGVILQAISMMK